MKQLLRIKVSKHISANIRKQQFFKNVIEFQNQFKQMKSLLICFHVTPTLTHLIMKETRPYKLPLSTVIFGFSITFLVIWCWFRLFPKKKNIPQKKSLGSEKAVRVLLAAGADPCTKDDEGSTSLHKAAYAGMFFLSCLDYNHY